MQIVLRCEQYVMLVDLDPSYVRLIVTSADITTTISAIAICNLCNVCPGILFPKYQKVICVIR